MTHFAFVAPPFPSHVRALEALADALAARGHRITWVQQHDVRALLGGAHGFHAVGARTHPPGTLAALIGRAARPGGPLGLRRVIADVAQATDMLCREAPAVLRAIGAEAVVADQMEAAGGLVAEALGLPSSRWRAPCRSTASRRAAAGDAVGARRRRARPAR